MARGRKTPYNVKLMDADRLARGWNYTDVARESGQNVKTVIRFFRREFNTPKAAKKIAFALGHPLDRYLPAVDERVSA